MKRRFIPTAEAYQLLHEGSIALAEVEATGVRVDKAYLERALDDTAREIRELEGSLRSDPIYRTWLRRYGDKANLGSPEQLAGVVFGELGYKSTITTSGGRASASASALEAVDLPFVKNYLSAQKLRKARGTYLVGIQREMVQHDDGLWYVHPVYNLNTVASFRSSAQLPNFQNNPIRNPMIGEIVRRCYIPRPGCHIAELDYSQLEVKTSTAYHHDPNLISYCTDSSRDMHRDMAQQIFLLTKSEVAKDVRFAAKSSYVFASFYGSYYIQTAPALWESMERHHLKVAGTDKSIRQHMAEQGITELGECNPKERPVRGTFEYHLKEIENDFWGKRFPTYAKWKEDWWAAYQRNGGCMFLTGFIMTGPHAKNDVINYPNQGSAFHLLLWSLIRIVRRLRRYKMRTRVIGEVHDSINGDTPPRERNDFINMSREIMTQDVKRYAPWMPVPLEVEPELCPIDAPWFEKAALKESEAGWVPADMEKWTKKYGPWEKQDGLAQPVLR